MNKDQFRKNLNVEFDFRPHTVVWDPRTAAYEPTEYFFRLTGFIGPNLDIANFSGTNSNYAFELPFDRVHDYKTPDPNMRQAGTPRGRIMLRNCRIYVRGNCVLLGDMPIVGAGHIDEPPLFPKACDEPNNKISPDLSALLDQVTGINMLTVANHNFNSKQIAEMVRELKQHAAGICSELTLRAPNWTIRFHETPNGYVIDSPIFNIAVDWQQWSPLVERSALAIGLFRKQMMITPKILRNERYFPEVDLVDGAVVNGWKREGRGRLATSHDLAVYAMKLLTDAISREKN